MLDYVLQCKLHIAKVFMAECPVLRDVKVSRYTTWKRLERELIVLDLCTRRGWVVSVTPRPRFTFEGRTPGNHWTGGWVGLRAGLDTETRRKIFCPCQGSKPARPVRSQIIITELLMFTCYITWAAILCVDGIKPSISLPCHFRQHVSPKRRHQLANQHCAKSHDFNNIGYSVLLHNTIELRILSLVYVAL
jgi:hypothetical protein